MESPHRHLGTGFSNRLGSDNPHRFACLDSRGQVFLEHPFQDLRELGIADIFVIKKLVQLVLGLFRGGLLPRSSC